MPGLRSILLAAATSLLLVIENLSAAPALEPAKAADPAKHWAFQPISSPAPPAVNRSSWPRSELDCFILAKLNEHNLPPAGPAPKRTLIRRATFDLTGLPPTPEEVDRFENDTSPDAFSKVVDRLLASPRYGERWGRHWLDVARYADSNGMDENLAYASAWRYRDYVVAAFNRDKPYDQFIREQIAGDLLPATGTTGDFERLIATGFLTIGPKMLAEDDPTKMEMDIIDEQLDTTCRTFMGLTVGCGRCHDHKFDPVPMADYYAMAGIFKSTRTMENFKVVARWQERPLGTPDEIERLAAHRQRIDEQSKLIAGVVSEANTNLLRDARARAADYLVAATERRALEQWLAGNKPPGSGYLLVEAENFQRSENILTTQTGYGEGIGIVYGPGGKLNAAEYDVTMTKPGWHRIEIRYAAAAERPVKLLINGKLAKSGVAGRTTGSWNPDTQTWEIAGTHHFDAGTNVVRLERDDCLPHIDKLLFVPVPDEAATKFAAGDAKAALVPEFVKQWGDYLKSSGHPPEPGSDAFQKLIEDPKGPFALPKNTESYFPAATIAEIKEARDKLKSLEQSLPTLPEAMAVADGTAQNLRIHKRGSHLTLGDETVRGLLKSIGPLPPPTLATNTSGRLQLADWLASPGHPLTARVMVNRIWHWHFGEGLVRSPDNFGTLGEPPSHPELLDWLARRFIDSGWSVKAMHRLIMASAVYQQASGIEALTRSTVAANAGDVGERSNASTLQRFNESADPENRLLSHFPRRRLEVEAIRDAVLFVSGGLDFKTGGSLLTVSNRVYVTSTANKLDASLFDQPVRSLYLPVVRSALYDVFQVFDFADPSVLNGRRDRTTVAPQALFMMNSRIVADAARRLAASLLAEKNLDDAARLEKIYQIAYSRPPQASERASALNFLSRHAAQSGARGTEPPEGRLKSWQSFARTVMAANEFIYVE